MTGLPNFNNAAKTTVHIFVPMARRFFFFMQALCPQALKSRQ